ncbi:MAG: ASCH domain-containing protein [Microcoleaceae cyanobacterium MO_207.B10]|nr:ASCH domain-containing protein [Microcoleaceae cyanobacterium MO_207.B10]
MALLPKQYHCTTAELYHHVERAGYCWDADTRRWRKKRTGAVEVVGQVCLSLRQPWAWAIFHAGKDIENRAWLTKYRGLLYIHASQSYDKGAKTWIEEQFDIEVPSQKDVETGKILGSVNLVNISSQGQSPWAMPNQYHWEIASPRLLDIPVPAKGRLNLWKFER